MHDKELDDLLSDDFLGALETGDSSVKQDAAIPEWVPESHGNNGFKAWQAIRGIRSEKENAIKSYGKIADRKTPKGLYKIKKSEVARVIGKDAQNLFAGKAAFCEPLSNFLDDQNEELFALFEKEQALLTAKQKQTGVRVKKKDQVVYEYQQMRDELNTLKCQRAKDVLDMAVSRLPLDLQEKLQAN